jgi:hypothetical protein
MKTNKIIATIIIAIVLLAVSVPPALASQPAQVEPIGTCYVTTTNMYYMKSTAAKIGTVTNLKFDVLDDDGTWKLVTDSFTSGVNLTVYVRSNTCVWYNVPKR